MKRKIIFVMFVFITIIAGLLLSYQSIENDFILDAAQREKMVITEDLNGKIVRQNLEIETHSIEGIKVKTATFDRIPVGSIKVQLLSHDNVIAEKDIKGDLIYNNRFINIEFNEKVKVDPGEFTIVFDLQGLHNTTPITFYVNKVENGPLLLNNENVISNSTLELHYYTHEFSMKRLFYIFISVSCLIIYTVFVLRLIKKSN